MAQDRKSRIAFVNYTAGRAIIVEEDDSRHMLEVSLEKVDGSKPFPAGMNFGMWLQPSGAQDERLDEASPYPALQKRMRDRLALAELIASFVCAIDPQYDAELRALGGEELERQLSSCDADVVARFREIVLNGELAATASTRDAPVLERGAALLAEVVAKWGHRPREAASA